MSNTIILQFYKAFDGGKTPTWIHTCMETVRAYAKTHDADYAFQDSYDAYCPQWVRDKCKNNLYALTDINRLYWLRNMLKEYQSVIWMDADILIWDRHDLPYWPFTREIFYDGETTKKGISNCMMAFFKTVSNKPCPFLEDYITKCETRLNNIQSRTALGPDILNNWPMNPDDCTKGVALLTPKLIENYVYGDGTLMDAYDQKDNFWAANVCHFMRDLSDTSKFDKMYNRAMRKLLHA
jgi:hypothetical protein